MAGVWRVLTEIGRDLPRGLAEEISRGRPTGLVDGLAEIGLLAIAFRLASLPLHSTPGASAAPCLSI